MDYYIIDRFEGEYAVCEAPDGAMQTIRQGDLPPDAQEGDLLYREGVFWKVDKAATEARRQAMMAKRAALRKKRNAD